MAGALAPALVVLIGLPGAGKSRLARALARRHGCARVDRDAFRAALARNRTGDSDFQREKRAAESALWLAAAVALARERTVVLDGMTFAGAAQRRRARAVARRAGVACVEAFLVCPVALAQRRIRGQRHPAEDRDAELVRAVARRFAPVPRRVLRLDARWSLARQLRALVARCPR